MQEMSRVFISIQTVHSSNKAVWNFASLDLTECLIAGCLWRLFYYMLLVLLVLLLNVKNDNWV